MDTLFVEQDADQAVEAIVRWNKILINRERNNKMQLIMEDDGLVTEVIESHVINRDELIANVSEMQACLDQAQKDLSEFDAFVLANDKPAVQTEAPAPVEPAQDEQPSEATTSDEPIVMPTVETPAVSETPAEQTSEQPTVPETPTEASQPEATVEPNPIVLQ